MVSRAAKNVIGLLFSALIVIAGGYIIYRVVGFATSIMGRIMVNESFLLLIASLPTLIGLVMVVGGIHYARKFWNAPGVANNRLKIVVGTVVAPLILIGVVGGVALASIPEYDLGEQERIAASSFNDMGADLGRALFEMEPQNKNIVYSPLSIGMSFSMVYAGSEGQARQELEEFLNVDVEPDQFHESNQEILRSLKDPEPQYRYHRMLGMANNIKTNIANGIWIRKDLWYKENYKTDMERFYDARVSNSAFDDETVKAINDWVNEQTEGKIERILEGFKATDAMVLINAIYFYGDWMKSFDPDDTSKEDFHRRDGSTVSVDMMQKTDTKFPYFRGTVNGSEVQAVRLPYGETGRLSMYVILPRSIPRLVERFDHQMLTTLQENVSTTEIDLHMPKYKADYEIQLDEVMRNELGMQNIFEDRPGDWDRMSENITRVDRSKHKAVVEVDEKGTEAAAATSVVMGVESDLTKTMRVDSPFMFLIADRETGSILFTGLIQDPS